MSDTTLGMQAFTTENFDEQMHFANDQNRFTRVSLALNRDLCIDAQHVLAKDAEYVVQFNLSINPSIADEIQLMLAEEGFEIAEPKMKTKKYLEMRKVLDK